MYKAAARLFRGCRHRPLRTAAATLAAAVLVWLAWPPGAPFPESYSTLVYDRHGNLLRAFMAPDQQFRFPPGTAELPSKYERALLTYEDRRFYRHPGVDPLALVRALINNVTPGRPPQGGSTITMQVARLSRPKARTYLNKLRECLFAFRYDLHTPKREILRTYANHVPLGGNVVGVHAGSYYYFGRPLESLTWAQAALFAVLPNAPSLMSPSRHRDRLHAKRNRLLRQLLADGALDSLSCRMACQEPLPGSGSALPYRALHFTRRAAAAAPGTAVRTSLDTDIQRTVRTVAGRHHRLLQGRGISSIAVVVVETATGLVRGYAGSHDFHDTLHAGRVDGVLAPRSTGSLLKPYLAALCLDKGPYTMRSRILDVPTFFGTFAPQNASRTWNGTATLSEVLIRSLNVPSVRLLNKYGVADFHQALRDAGITTLFRPPGGYGLTLILGGCEASLWELTGLYVSLANGGRRMTLSYTEPAAPGRALVSPGAAWLTLQEMTKPDRPGTEYYWRTFDRAVPVAWKTGTSYGQKDAWAIGTNAQYTVGVWTGNFDGSGNAALGGARTSAPVLFSLMNALTDRDTVMWFAEPDADLEYVACCSVTGYPAAAACPETLMALRPARTRSGSVCPYHRKYIIDRRTGKATCSLCWHGSDTCTVTRVIYPPAVNEVYRRAGIACDTIPAHKGTCPGNTDTRRLELVYPVNGVKILIPRDYDGTYERVVLTAKHQRPSVSLFWYLDGTFIRHTTGRHEFAYALQPGHHRLTVQDEEGFRRSVVFEVYKKTAP